MEGPALRREEVAARHAPHAGVRLALVALRGYKILLSPLFTGACRFLPSCSDYAAEAIATHGVGRGSIMAIRRLARCHPLGSSGYDPVPPRPAVEGRPAPGRAR